MCLSVYLSVCPIHIFNIEIYIQHNCLSVCLSVCLSEGIVRRRTFHATAFSASAANLHAVAVIRRGSLQGAPRLSSTVFSVGLVSTFFLMANISCPVSGCCFDGPLRRVLVHLRLSHRSVSCPADFVREKRLVQ